MTWADIIALLIEMFDVKQKVIAEKLGVSEALMSKFKKGTSPSFSTEYIYTRTFKPGGIPEQSESTKYLLNLLKDTINDSFPTIRDEMADCWEITDYESFVKRMLDRTTPVKKKKSKDLPQQKSVSDRIDSSDSDQQFEINAEIYIEDKFKCCLFCSYWHGKKEKDIKKCDVDEKPHRATDECEFYTANKDRITTAMLARH